jgi:predicted nucleic acid-binding protein
MICLDTNYLILGACPGTREARDLIAWARAGEPLVTPMLAWFEFVCGPVNAAQIAAIRSFLSELIPFDEAQAVEAARLFNAVGRKRAVRVDAMIAAAAIVLAARLATHNRADFDPFRAHGLKLVP